VSHAVCASIVNDELWLERVKDLWEVMIKLISIRVIIISIMDTHITANCLLGIMISRIDSMVISIKDKHILIIDSVSLMPIALMSI
jgi:hypothetical protein